MGGVKVDGWWFRRLRLAASAVLIAGAAVVITPSGAAATDPCAAPANPIVCENSKSGSPPSQWDVSGAGDQEIQGFATDISVNIGGQISFKINTDASTYSIDIYRLGYYGGNG